MKHPMLLTLLPLLTALACGPSHAQVTDSTPVIEAGGTALTKAEFEQLLNSDSRYQGAAGQVTARRALAVNFGKALALETEARKRKLDQVPSIQLKIRHATQQILAFELLSRLRSDNLKDEARLSAVTSKARTPMCNPKCGRS